MAIKDEWKETGKELGGAFGGLGKTILRSAKDGIDAVVGDDKEASGEAEKSTVFNDGTWRNTGKELGSSMKGLARSLVHTAKAGLDKLEEDDK